MGQEIINLPSNDFKNQEPKSNEEIKSWIAYKWNSKFLTLQKDHVNGPLTCELFRWLRQNSPMQNKNTGDTNLVEWNYAKFQIDSNGNVVGRFGPEVSPEEILPKIKKLLA